MVSITEVSKMQDKINISYEKVCCISCGEEYSKENKVYILNIKNYNGENYIPLCRKCLDAVQLNYELETLEKGEE